MNIKSHSYRCLRYFGISLVATLSLSCEQTVILNNPFDPEVILPAPTELQITSMTDSSVSLQWRWSIRFSNDAQEKESMIIIEQSLDRVNYSVLDSVSASATSSSTIKLFTTNQSYYFRAYAKVGMRSSFYSNLCVGTASFIGPSDFVAVEVSDSARIFTWKDNTTLDEKYCIERKAYNSESYVLVGTVSAKTTTFVDSTIMAPISINYRSEYYNVYKVYAVTGSGTKSNYDSVGVVIFYQGPKDLNYSIDSVIHLRWVNDWSAWGWSPINIERKDDSMGFHTITILDWYEDQFTDSPIEKNRNYQYRIQYLYRMTNYYKRYEATPYLYTATVNIP